MMVVPLPDRNNDLRKVKCRMKISIHFTMGKSSKSLYKYVVHTNQTLPLCNFFWMILKTFRRRLKKIGSN